MLLRLRLKLICKMWLVKLAVYMWGKVTRLRRGAGQSNRAKVVAPPKPSIARLLETLGTLAKIATFCVKSASEDHFCRPTVL